MYTWTEKRLNRLLDRIGVPADVEVEVSRECVELWHNLDTQQDALEIASRVAEVTGLTVLGNGYKYTVSRATLDSLFRSVR